MKRRPLTGTTPGIVFFGGEPLLRKDLIAEGVAFARAAAAKRRAIPHFKLTTNGVLLDDDFLDLCVYEDLSVSLSFEGVQLAHDRHRLNLAGHGTYAHVAERARALVRQKPYSPAIVISTPETVHHAAASVRHAFEIGFRYVVFQLNYAGAWTDAGLAELGRQYEPMAELYLEKARREEKFYLSPFDLNIETHIRGRGARGIQCNLGVRQVSVAPDGRLYPCVQLVPHKGRDDRYAIGDVFTGLDAVRRDAYYQETDREDPDLRLLHHQGPVRPPLRMSQPTLGIQTSQVVVPARPEAAGPTDLARCHRPRARPSKGREGSAQPVPPSRSPFEARACLPCSIHAPWARAPQGERIGDQDT